MQKFFRGQRVKAARICTWQDECEAIVQYSYSDAFHRGENGDHSDKSFSLLILKDGVGVNTIAWFMESDLTLLSDDRVAGEQLLQEWKNRCPPPMTFERIA